MKTNLLLTYLFVSLISISISLAQAPNLGTAATFALFTANGAFANTGASTVTGDIGTNVGAFTGFPPGSVNGQIRLPGSTEADQAATDVVAAYNMLSPLTCTTTILAQLGGQTLTPGVYCQPTANASSLNGTLTLSGAGVFVIKLNSALTTATNSTISLINGASACDVYFQVNGAVGLGTGSAFKGTILAAGTISLGVDASLEGRGLSTAGAIALNNNVVTVTNSVLSIDVEASACTPATNLYSISGTISSTNAPAATVTVTDGIVSTTVAIAAGETSTPYSLTGLMPGTGSHTVKVSCAGSTDSVTYSAPVSCTTSPASLGGMVYSDNNGNGVLDGGDTPIAGVTATLLDNTNAPITSTATSGTGLYSFPGLMPGVPYSVSFTTPPGFLATTPTTAGPVTLAAGEDNTSLSAGFQPVSGTIVSVTVTPGATDSTTNQYTLTGVISLADAPSGSLTVTDGAITIAIPITADQTSAVFSLTGLASGTGLHTVVVSGSGYTPFDVTYTAPASVVPADPSLGDFVFKDLNDNGRQDAGEPGVNNVKVTLHKATGGLPGPAIDSTLTANGGKYNFTTLLKGDYIVKIDLTTLPDSCLISTKPNAAGVPDSLDSDFGPNGLSPVVSIDPAQPGLSKNNLTVDAGLRPKLIPNPVYDLALDKSVDKKLTMLGDTVTYTIKVKNEGEATAHGIQVTDALNAGVQFLSSTATSGSYSSATKLWSFDSLTVGNTATLTIRVKVIAAGVWFNTAEITKLTEKDKDSTPGNGLESEDDIDRECFTVPIQLCQGDGTSVKLSVPAQYTNVVWFRKAQGGQPVRVGTGNSYTATETELGSFEYTTTLAVGNCPADGCCPTIIVVEDCCPAQVCVPVLIKKVKVK